MFLEIIGPDNDNIIYIKFDSDINIQTGGELLDSKSLLDALISFVIFIVLAIVFLVVLFFVINISAELVFGKEGNYGYPAIMATGIIVGASLIGGGALFKFKE